MTYQIKPKIKIGSFKDVLLKKEHLGEVLILTSKSLNKNHKIDEYFIGEQFRVISDVEPELPFSYIKDLYLRVETIPKLIIAIGGGSVIDLAKALSVCKSYDILVNKFYQKDKTYEKNSIVYALPTTFGTGAEMSFGSILFDDFKMKKGGLRNKIIQPDFVIIDLNLYKTATEKLMAETGFDCLTHAIETYLSKASNDIVRYQSITAINIVFNHLIPAVKKKDNKSILKMAITSMMMGVNLAFSSTCLPHRIQYVIGPISNTSHAQGLIMLYNGWLALIASEFENNDAMQNLLTDLGASFEKFKNDIEALKNELNINYKLSEFNITESQINSISNKVSGNLFNDPFYKDQSTIKYILKNSL